MDSIEGDDGPAATRASCVACLSMEKSQVVVTRSCDWAGPYIITIRELRSQLAAFPLSPHKAPPPRPASQAGNLKSTQRASRPSSLKPTNQTNQDSTGHARRLLKMTSTIGIPIKLLNEAQVRNKQSSRCTAEQEADGDRAISSRSKSRPGRHTAGNS